MPRFTKPLERFTRAGPLGRWHTGRVRRATALCVLVLLVIGVLLYRQRTAPDRILAEARTYLSSLIGGQVHIGSARFSIFGGIQLDDVSVSLREENGFLAGAGSVRDREVFRAEAIRLRPNLIALALGRPSVREILTSNAEFTLIRRMADGRHNWQVLLESRGKHAKLEIGSLPEIRLRDVAIRLRKLNDRGMTDLDTVYLSASARAEARSPMSYLVEWKQRGEESREGVLRVDLDAPGVEAKSGGLPSLNIDAVLAAMPGNVASFSEWLELLDLRGRLGVEALRILPTEPAEAVVSLAGVSFSVPMDERERALGPEDRLLRLEDVKGKLVWRGTRVEADVSGALNGQPCRLHGVLFVRRGGRVAWADVGFDLDLVVERFTLPVLSSGSGWRGAALARRFKVIRYLYDRYDPHGDFGLEATIERDPETESVVQVSRCTILPLGVDAMYANFPVRVSNLTGLIEYTPDGLTLTDLLGTYGGGTVVINGSSPQFSPTTGVNMTIEGFEIPLDAAIFAALPSRHQGVWRRFSPQGRVNTCIRLRREDRPSEPSSPFETEVDIEFLGIEARFDSFPYPVREIRGYARVDSSGTRIESLTGRRGPTRVAVDGRAVPREEGGTNLDLSLSVWDLPMDSVLTDCLPPDARRAVRQFGLAGRAELAGKIVTDAQTGRVIFDLSGSLKDGAFCHEAMPIPLTGVGGMFRLRPDRADLKNWSGRTGETKVEADGTLWLGAAVEREKIPWRIHCRKVECAGEIRDALPVGLREAWEKLGISGQVDVELEYTPGAAGADGDYRATLKALENRVHPPGFPWALESVTGRVVITPGAVEFQGLHGKHGSGEASLHGWYERGKNRAVVSVHAENVILDDSLRMAVPWRMRRDWNILQPKGSFDLHLSRLELAPNSEGVSVWTYEGWADLRDVGMNAGVELRGLFGRLRGGGRVVDGVGWTLDGSVAIDACRVNDHSLKDVKAVVRKTVGPDELFMDDIVATVYGGQAIGQVGVRLGQGGGYEFSVVGRDMELGPFLKALDGGGQSPGPMYGQVQGKAYYAAEFDNPEGGRGGGDLRISGAALFRLPLLLAILRVLDPIPTLGNDQDANMRFVIDHSRVDFQAISIRDRSLFLAGTGTMRLGEEKSLDVVLLAGDPPDRSTPLTVLQEFVQGALQELVEVRIKGTLDKPAIQSRPLRSLDRAIRTLTDTPDVTKR